MAGFRSRSISRSSPPLSCRSAAYMARVFEGERTFLSPVLGPSSAVFTGSPASTRRASSTGPPIRSPCCCSTPPASVRLRAACACRRCCRSTRRACRPVAPDLAFNTAVSFVTNTNWQAYGGESTLSYLSQMAGLTVQNFVSAATGIALAVALIRGFARALGEDRRQFLGRSDPLHPLRPAAALDRRRTRPRLAGRAAESRRLCRRDDARRRQADHRQGPAASQIAIKQLGTNGGGFFNANSAHPL